MNWGKYAYMGLWVKHAFRNSTSFLKSHSGAKKTENNRFRVPIHSSITCFTLEKFAPPPPLLHPNSQSQGQKDSHTTHKSLSFVRCNCIFPYFDRLLHTTHILVTISHNYVLTRFVLLRSILFPLLTNFGHHLPPPILSRSFLHRVLLNVIMSCWLF